MNPGVYILARAGNAGTAALSALIKFYFVMMQLKSTWPGWATRTTHVLPRLRAESPPSAIENLLFNGVNSEALLYTFFWRSIIRISLIRAAASIEDDLGDEVNVFVGTHFGLPTTFTWIFKCPI